MDRLAGAVHRRLRTQVCGDRVGQRQRQDRHLRAGGGRRDLSCGIHRHRHLRPCRGRVEGRGHPEERGHEKGGVDPLADQEFLEESAGGIGGDEVLGTHPGGDGFHGQWGGDADDPIGTRFPQPVGPGRSEGPSAPPSSIRSAPTPLGPFPLRGWGIPGSIRTENAPGSPKGVSLTGAAPSLGKWDG